MAAANRRLCTNVTSLVGVATGNPASDAAVQDIKRDRLA